MSGVTVVVLSPRCFFDIVIRIFEGYFRIYFAVYIMETGHYYGIYYTTNHFAHGGLPTCSWPLALFFTESPILSFLASFLDGCPPSPLAFTSRTRFSNHNLDPFLHEISRQMRNVGMRPLDCRRTLNSTHWAHLSCHLHHCGALSPLPCQFLEGPAILDSSQDKIRNR
jgi:hypothetical protein